jgi:CRP-like cAMP-binding protein
VAFSYRPEQLGSVAAVMTALPSFRGQPLLVEGEPSRGLFVVRTGKVIVRRSSEQKVAAAAAEAAGAGGATRQRSKSSPTSADKQRGPFQRGDGDSCDVVAELFPGDYFGERELRDGTTVSNAVEGGSDGGRPLFLSAFPMFVPSLSW